MWAGSVKCDLKSTCGGISSSMSGLSGGNLRSVLFWLLIETVMMLSYISVLRGGSFDSHVDGIIKKY